MSSVYIIVGISASTGILINVRIGAGTINRAGIDVVISIRACAIDGACRCAIIICINQRFRIIGCLCERNTSRHDAPR